MGKACARFFEGGGFTDGLFWRRAVSAFFFLLLAGVPALSLAKTVNYFKNEDAKYVVVRLGEEIRQKTEPCALVVTFYGGNPTLLYYADRKGWLAVPEELTVEFLERKRTEGASYAAGLITHPSPAFRSPATRKRLDEAFQAYEKVVVTDEFFLIKLHQGEACAQ